MAPTDADNLKMTLGGKTVQTSDIIFAAKAMAHCCIHPKLKEIKTLHLIITGTVRHLVSISGHLLAVFQHFFSREVINITHQLSAKNIETSAAVKPREELQLQNFLSPMQMAKRFPADFTDSESESSYDESQESGSRKTHTASIKRYPLTQKMGVLLR